MPAMSKSLTTTRPKRLRIPPLHPGEMLREEFMIPMGLSAYSLAVAIGVPATRIREIANERRGITADTALRLGQYFQVSAEFWMNVQQKFELDLARDISLEAITRDVHPATAINNASMVSAQRRVAQPTNA